MANNTFIYYMIEQKKDHTVFVGQSAKTGKTLKLSKVMLRLSPEAVMVIAEDLCTTLEALANKHKGEVDLGVKEDTTPLTDTFAKYKNKDPFPASPRNFTALDLLTAAFGIDGSRLSSDVKQNPHRPVKGPQPAG
jgi:hypothetical protein